MDEERSFKEREENPRHIVIGVMGATGAGKSTLAQELGKSWGVSPLQEEFGENPFLAKFYSNPDEFSFDCQSWFLIQKAMQLNNLKALSSPIIIDPPMEMDYLYAKVHHDLGWMDDDSWALYKEQFGALSTKEGMAAPDAYVVVRAPDEVLIDRIRKRGRHYELIMLEKNPEYFIRLSHAVDAWAQSLKPDVCKIEFDSGFYNFTQDGDHKNEVLGALNGHIVQWLSTEKPPILPPPF